MNKKLVYEEDIVHNGDIENFLGEDCRFLYVYPIIDGYRYVYKKAIYPLVKIANNTLLSYDKISECAFYVKRVMRLIPPNKIINYDKIDFLKAHHENNTTSMFYYIRRATLVEISKQFLQ